MRLFEMRDYASMSTNDAPWVMLMLAHYMRRLLFDEQCNSLWMTRNVTTLRDSLESNVFGQHIATKLILSALSRRWTTDEAPKKPLVMSFHGWTGSGKNYVARFVTEALFERGLASRYV